VLLMPMPADADADADADAMVPCPAGARPGTWGVAKLGQPRAVDGASAGASADLALPVR